MTFQTTAALSRSTIYRILLGTAAIGCGLVTSALAGSGELANDSVGSLLAWSASIVFALLACAPLNGRARQEAVANQEIGPREWLLMIALFLGAFALRAYQNDAIPAALNGDEGSTGVYAARVARGELTNLFGMGWYSFPALFFAIPAATINLFGPTYGALRLPSALAGALTVAGLYWWMRSAFGWKVGLASALMLSVSHYHIHWSRIGLNNIWDSVFLVFVGGLVWQGWRTGNRWMYIGAGVLTGLSQYFYTGSRALPIILACWLASALIFERRRLISQLPNAAAMAFVALVVFLPLGLYFARHPDQFEAPSARVGLLRPDWPEKGGNWFQYTARQTRQSILQVLAANIRDAALGFVWLPMRSWYAEAGKPLLLILPSLFALIGLAWLIIDVRNSNARFLLLALGTTIAIASITESTPAGQRYAAGASVAAACVGLGFALTGRLLVDLFNTQNRIGYAIAAAALGLGLLADLNFYFRDYAPEASRGDANTQIATELSRRIARYPDRTQFYMFAAPRMSYAGFATLAFTAPHVQGIDVLEPLTSPPTWPMNSRPTGFAFTPERAAELAFVKQSYPNGREEWIKTLSGQPLVLLYEVGTP